MICRLKKLLLGIVGGIEQTPGLGSSNNDRTKWNSKNFKALKETLKQFILLIRFSEISSTDFLDKVRHYKAIIPHHIYEGVAEFYYKNTLPKTTTLRLPPRAGKIKIESKIIKPKLANMIASCIERSNEKNLSHLLLKKSTSLVTSSQDHGINNL
jgi:hypothetical protein